MHIYVVLYSTFTAILGIDDHLTGHLKQTLIVYKCTVQLVLWQVSQKQTNKQKKLGFWMKLPWRAIVFCLGRYFL